jgi:hypothetical protein
MSAREDLHAALASLLANDESVVESDRVYADLALALIETHLMKLAESRGCLRELSRSVKPMFADFDFSVRQLRARQASAKEAQDPWSAAEQAAERHRGTP